MAKMPDHVDFDVRIHGVPTGYKLVPIDPPDDLAYQLTGYSLHPRHGLSERDRKVIRERLRERWDAILAALAPLAWQRMEDSNEDRLHG